MVDREEDLSTPPATADTIEALLARVVSAPDMRRSLTAGETVAGRYVVERILGSGGMGTVYLVHDRKLDRRVAIKLHRRSGDAERLQNEAQAMAKLQHPNVVAVYEVGEVEGSPFVVMEYVAGQTLRAWLRTSRTASERFAMLHAVGAGLVAAHAAGLVHRDIKPDNVLVGDDGRARIGDFGLARTVSESDRDAGAGTPAYMAPEQAAGKAVDERSDQYAFGVMAWEALTGELPPGGKLPSRVRRVLERALAKEPAARWPSMEAFLDALRVAERRPTQILVATAGTLVLAGAVTAWAWPAADPAAACESVTSELDRALPASEVSAVVAQVAKSGAPHAERRAQLVEKNLAAHRVEHTKQAQAACRARATKSWSRELSTASTECLALHARTMREQVRSVPITATTVADFVQLAARVPAIAACTDARILAGWRPVEGGDAAITTRARLAVAKLHVELGQLAPARKILGELATDTVAPNVRRRGLVEAMLAVSSNNLSVVPQLEKTYFDARAADDGEVMLATVATLLRVTASLQRDAVAARKWIDNGIADAQREVARNPAGAALVYLSAAAATAKAGESERALEWLGKAEELIANKASLLRASLLSVRADIFAELGRHDESVAALDSELQSLTDAYGAEHPLVAEVHAERAATLLEAGREQEAVAAMKQAMAIADDDSATSSPSLAALETTIGATLLGAGDPRASTYLERARTRLVAAYGEDHPDVALVDTNLALVYLDKGEKDRALSALRHAIAIQERMLGADHLELGPALYNLAVTERETGNLDAARATATRCAAIYEKRQPGSPRHVYALGHLAMIANLAKQPAVAVKHAEAALAVVKDESDAMGPAWAKFELATALIALKQDPVRARKALLESRVAYEHEGIPERVTAIDALLAKVR